MTENDHCLSPPTTPGAYTLLQAYIKEADQLSGAYSLAGDYYRLVYKTLAYPLVVVTAANSVFAAAGVNVLYRNPILIGLSLCSLILAGFSSLLNPQEKANRVDQVSTKFDEIAADARQFLHENSKTRHEIKSFSQLTHELLDTWKSLMPPIPRRFFKSQKPKA